MHTFLITTFYLPMQIHSQTVILSKIVILFHPENDFWCLQYLNTSLSSDMFRMTWINGTGNSKFYVRIEWEVCYSSGKTES